MALFSRRRRGAVRRADLKCLAVMAFGGPDGQTVFRGTDTAGDTVDLDVLDQPAVLFVPQDAFRLLQQGPLGTRVKGTEDLLDLADSSDPIAGFARLAKAVENARSVPLDLQPGEYYAKIVPNYREATMVVEMCGEMEKNAGDEE